MSVIGWIIVLVLVVPIIGFLVWRFLATSFVRVPSGSLGLLMIKGKAADTSLLPGWHFLPALRRRMVEQYPSVELAYRAGGPDDPGTVGLNQSGPPLPVTLGNRPVAVLSVTVRFRLIPEQLRLVHDRFGPDGIFGVVRDETGRAVTTVLAAPGTGIDALFGPAREESEKLVHSALESALAAAGMQLTSLLLGPADLGRTGEVIAATARAGYELEREQAEAATRQARAAGKQTCGAISSPVPRPCKSRCAPARRPPPTRTSPRRGARVGDSGVRIERHAPTGHGQRRTLPHMVSGSQTLVHHTRLLHRSSGPPWVRQNGSTGRGSG